MTKHEEGIKAISTMSIDEVLQGLDELHKEFEKAFEARNKAMNDQIQILKKEVEIYSELAKMDFEAVKYSE